MPIEYRSDALVRSLAALHRSVPDLRGTAIITQDGLVIAAYPPGWDADIHAPTGGEHVAALAAVVLGQAEQALARLDQGQLVQVLMEAERGTLCVLRATHDAALALLVDKDAKLGLTLHAARQASQQISTILNTSA